MISLTTRVGDLARRLVAVDAHAVVVDDDRRALGGRPQRDGATDAASRAGDRDHLAVECTHELTSESTGFSAAAR